MSQSIWSVLVPVVYVGAKSGADEAVGTLRVVVEAYLKGYEAVLPEVHAT
jgi:hypothetical protein